MPCPSIKETSSALEYSRVLLQAFTHLVIIMSAIGVDLRTSTLNPHPQHSGRFQFSRCWRYTSVLVSLRTDGIGDADQGVKLGSFDVVVVR